MRIRLLFFLAAILNLSLVRVERAAGDLVTFHYTGTVTNITQFNLDLFPGASVGDPVSGTFPTRRTC